MVSYNSFHILAEYGVLDHQFRKWQETKMKMIYKTQPYCAKQLVFRVWYLPSFLVKGFLAIINNFKTCTQTFLSFTDSIAAAPPVTAASPLSLNVRQKVGKPILHLLRNGS